MLPGLGFSEIVLLGVIALLVVGPKDLPLMMRKLGRQMAKFRALANEFRTGFDELARQAELDELKKEVDALRRGGIADIEAEAVRPYTPHMEGPAPDAARLEAANAEDATPMIEPPAPSTDPETAPAMPTPAMPTPANVAP